MKNSESEPQKFRTRDRGSAYTKI